MNHIEKTSLDGTQFNLDALYKIAPSCFTEAKGEDGTVRRVVDFNKLRLLLGDDTVEDAPEVYDFTWVGKRAALKEAAAPIRKTLRPCPEESVDWDNTQNLYIEGDNLEVLKLLQNSYMGKVKMIYIDPPYNTGNDFVYQDDFHRTQREEDEAAGIINEDGERMVKNTESNGKFHSDWCSMMYSRLIVARTLLHENGVIFISIDDNEVENLRKICDEVFGEQNSPATIIWEKADSPRMDAKSFSSRHDFILVYAKNFRDEIFNKPTINEIPEHYDKTDDNGNRYYLKPLRYMGNADTREARPNLYFPIQAPNGEIIYPIRADGSDGRWRWSKEKVQSEYNRLEFVNGRNGWSVYTRIYADTETTLPIETIWYNKDVGSNRTAMATLKRLFKDEKPFTTPKPVELIKMMLKITGDQESVVLDFFSGSSTTAQAVMQLNAEDGGNRKYIMIQWPEVCDENSEAYKAGYKNICEIGKERIRRAGKYIKEELHLAPHNLDTGFRVFKCDDSNYKVVAFTPKDYSQESLDLFVDNIKEDRSDLDLLFECMLRWGVELSMPMNKTKVDGCTIYDVDEGSLVACLDGKVTEKVIDAIASMSPVRIVFRDSSFTEAASKMNLYELFKQKCGWSEAQVMKNVRVI